LSDRYPKNSFSQLSTNLIRRNNIRRPFMPLLSTVNIERIAAKGAQVLFQDEILNSILINYPITY